MQEIIRLVITQTAKRCGNNKERYHSFNQETMRFSNMKEAEKWLKERYGNCKKERVFIDDENGNPLHIGYIYSFRTSYYPDWNEKYFQSDWVDFRTEKPIVLSK